MERSRHVPNYPYRLRRDGKTVYGSLVTNYKNYTHYLFTGDLWVVDKQTDLGTVAVEEFQYYPCQLNELEKNAHQADDNHNSIYMGDILHCETNLGHVFKGKVVSGIWIDFCVLVLPDTCSITYNFDSLAKKELLRD